MRAKTALELRRICSASRYTKRGQDGRVFDQVSWQAGCRALAEPLGSDMSAIAYVEPHIASSYQAPTIFGAVGGQCTATEQSEKLIERAIVSLSGSLALSGRVGASGDDGERNVRLNTKMPRCQHPQPPLCAILCNRHAPWQAMCMLKRSLEACL